MKIKEIRYERLFNLKGYNNERIGFTAELSEGDDENKALGELFFKTLEVEECLEAYRKLAELPEAYDRLIADEQRRITDLKTDIADMKMRLNELMELINKGGSNPEVVDARLRHACDSRSYARMLEELKEREKRIRDLREKHGRILEAINTLRKRIQQGIFKTDDLDVLKEEHPIKDYW